VLNYVNIVNIKLIIINVNIKKVIKKIKSKNFDIPEYKLICESLKVNFSN